MKNTIYDQVFVPPVAVASACYCYSTFWHLEKFILKFD